VAVDKGVLERIKKLHAKAESLQKMGPNSEAEAQLFMAAVQQMLDKYQLELSEVDYQLSLTNDPVKMHRVLPQSFGKRSSKQVSLWQAVIAYHLCDLFDCAYIRDSDVGNSFWIIGRREHRQVADYMCTVILRLAEDLSYKAYVKEYYRCRDLGDVTLARGYKQGFLVGFAQRLAERCQELQRSRTQAGRGVALIRISQEKALVKQAMDELKAGGAIGEGKSKPSQRKVAISGVVDGEAAAEGVNLQGKALAKPKEPTKAPKLLGAGPTA
jgi:hypothetical protein